LPILLPTANRSLRQDQFGGKHRTL